MRNLYLLYHAIRDALIANSNLPISTWYDAEKEFLKDSELPRKLELLDNTQRAQYISFCRIFAAIHLPANVFHEIMLPWIGDTGSIRFLLVEYANDDI